MITSEKIKNLRLKTGAGMMDCKKALEEVNGDIDSAVDWLRKKGISTAQKKSSRDASEGLITLSIRLLPVDSISFSLSLCKSKRFSSSKIDLVCFFILKAP